MSECGTRAWLGQRHGRMTWRDRLGFLLQGVQARAATRRELQRGITFAHQNVDDIIPPDTPVTRAALALCEAAGPPWLVNHCLRAYLWARLLDKRTRSFDDEATYVALLLHDLGLTAQYRLSAESTQQCFTAAGADVAFALATQHGWPDRRAALAAEAIALHLNVTIADRHGPEAWLVRAGSGADIAGLGLHRVHSQDVEAVVHRHPRLGIKQEMTAVLATECHAHPGSRIAFLVQRLGFNALVRNARMFSE